MSSLKKKKFNAPSLPFFFTKERKSLGGIISSVFKTIDKNHQFLINPLQYY